MCFKLHNIRNFANSQIRKIMELIPSIQISDWGKLGTHSKVATLFKNVNTTFNIDSNKPYAELWMGTHVNGPSIVKSMKKPLSEVLTENPNYIGNKVINKFGRELPYLLKVLSIRKALSIQVHPSKAHAEKLHFEQPHIYKDPNHKPEMAIALTPFEALCGFRPSTEIIQFFQTVPEFRNIIGDELCNKFSQDSSENNMKMCFHSLMTVSEDKIKLCLKNILERFNNLDHNSRKQQLADLLERLYKQFPDDVGCFVIYFLNVLELKPTEAIYLGANEPHAYLSGDCVECMACSDNTVRAGLTPKFKDVETLCSMLNYRGEPASSKLFQPVKENEYTVIFKPPVPDFAVAKIDIAQGKDEVQLIVRSSGSILLIISGSAKVDDTKLIAGSSVFIPANDLITLKNVSEKFLAFQAMANV